MGELHKHKKAFEKAMKANDIEAALKLANDANECNNHLRELLQEIDNYRNKGLVSLYRRKNVAAIDDVFRQLENIERLLKKL